MDEIKKLTIAINQAIQGYLFKDGEITEIPELLRMMANDYEKEIKEEIDE